MAAVRYGTVERTVPKRIDFRRQYKDKLVAWYAKAGKSVKFIMSKTGYTFGQVVGRMQKASISLKDVRNGTSDYEEMLLHNAAYKGRVTAWLDRTVPDPLANKKTSKRKSKAA